MDGCRVRCNVVKNTNNRLVIGGNNYRNPLVFSQFEPKKNDLLTNSGLNLDFIKKENRNEFNFQNSFHNKQIPLWENEKKKVGKKSLFSYIVLMSFFVFSLNLFKNGSAGNFVKAENQTGTDFILNAESQIFIKDKNVGIGEENPQYKMEVGGSLFLKDSSKPVSSNNHSGIYSSGGELYVLDSSGNSTKISAHDEKGLWQFSSVNKEGNSLEVDMESLTKELNKILGGGYITENGKVIDQGRNAIDKLTLQINENAGTLDELKSSVDKNLKVINKEIDKYDKKVDDILDSISDLEKKQDSFSSLQDKLDKIDLENESLLNFFLAINPKTLVYLDKEGNLNLDGLLVAKEIAVKKITTEKISIVSNDQNQSLGESSILAGETTIFVKNSSIEESDKIFITPKVSIKQAIAITEIKSGEGFKVSISEPIDKDLVFNWFVINEVNQRKNSGEKVELNQQVVITPPEPNQVP